jgi:hypothetical protein
MDFQTFSTSEIEKLLSHLHRGDGSLTVELRFSRNPAYSGLRAAVVCRVDGTAPDAVVAQALDALDALLRCELAAMTPLDQTQLLAWLYGLEPRPTWAWIVERRLLVSDASMPVSQWAFQPLIASTEGWHSLLDVLIGLPTPTVLGVRLKGVVTSRADEQVLDSLLATFDAFAVPGWDEAAGAMGMAIRRSPSSFAIDATTALRAVRQRWSSKRYRIAMTVCGTGGQGALGPMLEKLVPGTPSNPASGAFSSSPLHVLSVPPESLPEVDLHQQTLDFNDLHEPARSQAQDSIGQLANTVDDVEATALFHLPRTGRPPTPGFRTRVEPETGIPTAPFVFISYNHVDQDRAAELVLLLREWQIAVWWDAMIVGGSEWHDELYAALQDGRCKAVVVALTERTDVSEWVKQEVSEARRCHRLVIQLMLRPTPPLDSSLQWIDLTNWTGSRADGRLALLQRDILAVMS